MINICTYKVDATHYCLKDVIYNGVDITKVALDSPSVVVPLMVKTYEMSEQFVNNVN